MRIVQALVVLGLGLVGEVRAQATQPAQSQPTQRVDVTGRAIELQLPSSSVHGELLAIRRDSAWVLTDTPRRIVALGIADIQGAAVRRHGLTGNVGLTWGIAVGALSGLGLTAACSSVKNASCGGVLPASLLAGLLWGGISAISYHDSSRRVLPVTPDALAPYARFPQGPPPGMTGLAGPGPDSLRVRP